MFFLHFFSACYDNTVCLWDAKDGSKKQQIPSHVSPVRDVAFIDVDENMNATFVSVSHDQTVVLHKYCSESNSIEGKLNVSYSQCAGSIFFLKSKVPKLKLPFLITMK